MMMINKINLNHLRVFEVVYRLRNMTNAAKELHLTQSGISQHIKSLEESLGIVLFDRIQHKIVPTTVANVLFERCTRGFYVLEKTLWQITEKDKELVGLVKIGMPSEFGNNLILPIVSRFLKKHPFVSVEIFFGLAAEVNTKIVSGELDYGYVDEFNLDKRLSIKEVFTEIHELCATPKYMKDREKPQNKRSYYETLEFIDYQVGEPVLRRWLQHHIKTEMEELNVRAYAENPYSVLQLIINDVGAGILPRHMVNNVARSGQVLYCFPGSGKFLKEQISVAHLPGRSHTRAAVELGDFVFQELAKVKT